MRELSVEELAQMETNAVSQEELAKVWDLFPNQEFITAMGAVIMLRSGHGQERNKPFQTQAEADADVSNLEKIENVNE